VDNHGLRYYDPEVGRYLTRDPIGYGDGPNAYIYVGNNPINKFDPLGLKFFGTLSDAIGQGISAFDEWAPAKLGTVGAGFSSTVLKVAGGIVSSVDSLILAPSERMVTGEVAAKNIPVFGPMGHGLGTSINEAIQNPNVNTISDAAGNIAGCALMALTPLAGKGGPTAPAVSGDAAAVNQGSAANSLKPATGEPTSPPAPAAKPLLKYHYTAAPEESFKEGLRSQSHVTDNPNLTAAEAVDQLGVTRPPDKVIPIVDKGNFQPARPSVVDQNLPKVHGGGRDFFNEARVPVELINPAFPIKKE
jgi:hypothetical protein